MTGEASTIKSRLQEDMKAAMKAQDKARLGVIRLVNAAIKQREVDERITLTDEQVLSVMDKMVKQRRDSITQYQSGGRQDLADQEAFEISVIQHYMPAQLSEAELDTLIAQAISSSGAKTAADMGKVMGILKPQIQGRCDMGAVSKAIKAKLAS